MEVKNEIEKYAIGDDFTVSDLVGRYGKTPYAFMGRDVKNEMEAPKMIGIQTDTVLSNEFMNALRDAPKFIIADMVTGISGNSTLLTSEEQYIPEGFEYNRDVAVRDGNNEYYEKPNTDVNCNGIYFLGCVINDRVHILNLNVCNPGQTGSSATLSYMPNGKFDKSIVLNRFCFHGENSNTHVNNNGDSFDKNDLHEHIQSTEFMEAVLGDRTLTEEKKGINLNSPTAHFLDLGVDNSKITASLLSRKLCEKYGIYTSLLHVSGDNYNSIVSSFRESIDQAEDICGLKREGM